MWFPELLDREVEDPGRSPQQPKEEEVEKVFHLPLYAILFLIQVFDKFARCILCRDVVNKIGDAAEDDKKVNIRVSHSPPSTGATAMPVKRFSKVVRHSVSI